MLGQRIITGLILIALVTAGILYLPTPMLALLFAVAVAIAAHEWARLAGIAGSGGRIAYTLLLVLAMAGLLLAPDAAAWRAPLAGVATLWWLLVTLWLILYRPGQRPASRPLKLLFGLLVLLPAWNSLVALHAAGAQGPLLVLFVMVLIWVADSAAYFSGRRWGRVKLAPQISPGKSREGVYGAVVGAALCGLLLGLLRPDIGSPGVLVPLSIAVALISVVGDLFESLMKRQAGLKDSGALLPGHGGMLDRIDSLTAAAPLFLSALILLGAGV